MKCFVAAFLMLTAGLPLFAVDTQRVADRVALDAAVLDRVAEVSKRDLPDKLLQRMVNEDVELMRGPRADGSYEFATWERLESGRISDSFSIKPSDESMQTVEVKGSQVYRVVLQVPDRRMLVRKNRQVWIERVDVEYVGEGSRSEKTSIEVKTWLQPGEFRPVDLPAVAKQATARVIATADPKAGPATLTVALVNARLVDLATSPYANAVAAAKTALKAISDNDPAAIRSAAQRMRTSLGVVAPAAAPAQASVTGESAAVVEMQAELQLIEDLLTGSEDERRQGLDRLHQLIRRIR